MKFHIGCPCALCLNIVHLVMTRAWRMVCVMLLTSYRSNINPCMRLSASCADSGPRSKHDINNSKLLKQKLLTSTIPGNPYTYSMCRPTGNTAI